MLSRCDYPAENVKVETGDLGVVDEDLFYVSSDIQTPWIR